MNKKYALMRTDTANAGLRKIILGIAERFGSDVALQKLDEMEKAIDLLKAMPYMGSKPHYMVLRRMGYLVLILEKSLVFYKVEESEKTVVVYAIVDQREDYVKILQGL